MRHDEIQIGKLYYIQGIRHYAVPTNISYYVCGTIQFNVLSNNGDRPIGLVVQKYLRHYKTGYWTVLLGERICQIHESFFVSTAEPHDIMSYG